MAFLNGTDADDIIYGTSVADTINGGLGADTMIGGLGNDTYIVDNIGDTIIETNASVYERDTVQASVSYTLGSTYVENLILTGTDAINGTGNALGNFITGNSAANVLDGGAGNNVLDGGAGADTMIGGANSDRFFVDDIGDVVIDTAISSGGVTYNDEVWSSITYVLGATIERLTLIGTEAINGTGNDLDNVISGNSAGNILDGGAGNDRFWLGSVPNAPTGSDTMIGGSGNDYYEVDDIGDVVIETSTLATEIDLVQSYVSYTLGANVENLTLTGTAAINGIGNELNNVITGNGAANVLNGRLGADTMTGGFGNDIYVVDNAGDTVTEHLNAGTDTVRSSVNYTLSTNVENLTLTGTAAINGIGNELNNVITGNGAANVLNGRLGADTMTGGFGNDSYVVDNINDVVVETSTLASEQDRVVSSITYTLGINVENLGLIGTAAINGTGNELDNQIDGNAGSNILDGGLGRDNLNGQFGADTMIGGLDNDLYTVDNIGDVVIETSTLATEIDWVVSSVTHTLSANVENLSLIGAAAISGTGNELDNNISGQANSAANVLTGGAGNDYYVIGVGDTVVENASEGIDTVSSVTSTTLVANVENLNLGVLYGALSGTGNELNNVITVLRGWFPTTNDTLDGGMGADTMSGSLGNDTYVVDNAGDVVIENLNEGTDTVLSSVSYTLGKNVENLTLTGTAAINGTGNELNNVINGNAAYNFLYGGAGSDVLDGGEGGGQMFGGDGADTLIGGTGVDYLLGDAGADYLVGGESGDGYWVDDIGDVVIETSALASEWDWVDSSVSYTLGANVEELVLVGSDAISGTGNELDNSLAGRFNGAANELRGGLGNDTYRIGTGDTVVENAGEGVDTVISDESSTLSANVENLTLYAMNYMPGGSLTGTGNELNNILTVQEMGYSMFGPINVTLDGGAGADTMTGGSGNDTYVVDNVGDVVIEGGGDVHIMIYPYPYASVGVDTVQSSITYTLGANVENLTLTGAASIYGTGNELNNVITSNGASNVLDGGAGADTMIGGGNSDRFFVDNIGDVVIDTAISSGGVTYNDEVWSSITYTLGATIEQLTLTGTAAINGTGNDLDNVISGNSAGNILEGGAGNDRFSLGTVPGAPTGSDTMIGGSGNDSYEVDDVGDVVIEQSSGDVHIMIYPYPSAGVDTVYSSITYTLGDNVENLVLTGTDAINGTGNALNNAITGNSAANILNGGIGADTMTGGLGDDTYVVDNIGDVVIENNNPWHFTPMPYINFNTDVDTVQSSISYTLGANIENLTLTGAASNGTGNELNNVITGNSGVNFLDGGSGADTMIGGLGRDYFFVDNIGDVVIDEYSRQDEFGSVWSSVSYALGNNLQTLILTGTNAINGTGNELNNAIVGNDVANTLDGGAGSDDLRGGGGNDLVIGGSGDDFLWGETGADTMIGGEGSDTYTVDDIGDVVTEEVYPVIQVFPLPTLDIDTVQSSITYTLGANVENLDLTGTAAINGAGNELNNVITGNSGVNFLDGGSGADTMIGGLGRDYFTVDNIGDVVIDAYSREDEFGSVWSSVSYALGNNLQTLILTGTNAINGTGNELNNAINGNDVANILDGGLGADILRGGLGRDTYVVDDIGDVVIENYTNPHTEMDEVRSSIAYILGANVEALTLTGTAAVNGAGNELDNWLTGNAAANVLDGGSGDDQLFGGAGADTLIGGSGVDYLMGDAGADSMAGGTGGDGYWVDNIGDVINETSTLATEWDWVSSSVSYALRANLEELTLTGTMALRGTGNELNNRITGNGAANVLNGGAGADTMTGGFGKDTYVVDNSGDVVIEAVSPYADIDTVMSSITYTLGANVENLTLTGASLTNGTGNMLNNVLIGNSAANALTGGAGNDTLTSGAGNDTLTGGAGSDTLTGGTGADIIRLSEATQATDRVVVNTGDSLVAGMDRIYRFNATATLNDQLDLASATIAGDQTVNGMDSNLIKSHSISSGMISFDNLDAYAEPLIVNSGNAADVSRYLAKNIATGDTAAFYVDANNNGVYTDVGDYLRVFQGGVTAAGTLSVDDTFVDIYTTSGLGGVTALGLAAAANTVQII